MTRDEKISFIEKHHPKLFDLLKVNVPDLIEDVWSASLSDIQSYNAFVAFYCGENFDVDLMKKLLF